MLNEEIPSGNDVVAGDPPQISRNWSHNVHPRKVLRVFPSQTDYCTAILGLFVCLAKLFDLDGFSILGDLLLGHVAGTFKNHRSGTK